MIETWPCSTSQASNVGTNWAPESSWLTQPASSIPLELNTSETINGYQLQRSASLPRRWTAGSSGGSVSSVPEFVGQQDNSVPPKIGTRFSKESARVLKQWLNAHSHYPYPNHADKQSLQLLTGLSKTQITNWLANARRRQKAVTGSRSIPSPQAEQQSAAAIRRPGTPMPRRITDHHPDMDPLERWVESPPDDEPATVHAIARAISSGGGISSGRKADDYSLDNISETFRAKYEWQRHEKSLHIPLERWMCAPDGPRRINPETNQLCCVFCGEVDPDDTHVAQHNAATCQERVFNRKDHLKQHLKLVHNAKGVDWVLKHWKTSSPAVRSRCGFCQKTLETWEDRVDHLADHFKAGKTMADWKDDWGFEGWVLETIENFIPPYVIEHERHTPFPFNASVLPSNSPRCAYELITLELEYYVQRHWEDVGQMPTNREMQLEACRIIFAAEALAPITVNAEEDSSTSWLRDLITSDDTITQEAKFRPMRSQAENRLSTLRINGKRTFFESCPLESQLREFVHTFWATRSAVPTNTDLQGEACRATARMEEALSSRPPDFVVNWLTKLITSSDNWLTGFKRRNNVLSTSENPCLLSIDGQRQHTGSSYVGVFTPHGEMAYPVSCNQVFMPSLGNGIDGRPSERLSTDKAFDHLLFNMEDVHATPNPGMEGAAPFKTSFSPAASPLVSGTHYESFKPIGSRRQDPGSSRPETWLKSGNFDLNDSNSHRWLSRELKRWVNATMSPNNPNRHIPSNEEIRHQARCLLFDESDDPWNQTAADNAEWLEFFKREAGIP
ncbi:C2H2 type zinc finger domain-containing protein [Colletotrichum truncatum]|uniref:C2H2 type zinc finger domain-containing protein n=1 Tax=Colletotrichum truncatum TaxID=5467 RepID=A0ACC3YCX8_COLTU